MPQPPNTVDTAKTRIAFYVGPSASLTARLQLACKLVEKAYQQRLSTYIYLDNAQHTEQLDQLLWTYQDTGFLPHARLPTTDKAIFIVLGTGEPPQEYSQLLINLSNQVPTFLQQFDRMAEIIDQEAEILNAGRQRYQLYRQQGYTLDYHQLR